MEINNVIKDIFYKQLQIEKNTNKVHFFNNLIEKNKISIPYNNILYSSKPKIIIDVLNISNVEAVKNQFVDYNVVDNVITIKYQNLSNIKSYIKQMVNMDDIDFENYLATESYAETFLLKKKNSYLYYSYVGEIFDISKPPKNTIIGFSDLKKYFIESNIIIDFNIYNKVGKADFFITKNEINTDYSIKSDIIVASNIEVDSPYFYFNRIKINESFITKNNLFLNNNCILNNHKQIYSVFYVKNLFITNKAQKKWIVPYLKKEDSGKTGIIEEITKAIIFNTKITQQKETITNEEALNILNNITKAIENNIGAC